MGTARSSPASTKLVSLSPNIRVALSTLRFDGQQAPLRRFHGVQRECNLTTRQKISRGAARAIDPNQWQCPGAREKCPLDEGLSMQHAAIYFHSSRRVNLAWHAQNPRPTEATSEEGLTWHLMHAARCNCFQLPIEVRRELERRQIFAFISEPG